MTIDGEPERCGSPLGGNSSAGAVRFVAADVAKAIGVTNIHTSLQLLDGDERGLYSLILRSRKPEARLPAAVPVAVDVVLAILPRVARLLDAPAYRARRLLAAQDMQP